MPELFSRYLTPLTYLLWVMIIVGGINHFAIEFLPPRMADVNLYVLWPLLAIVWFGHRHNARIKAQEAMRGETSDNA